VKALEDDGLNTFALSIPSIVIFTIVSILLALVAAWWPSRKAANANILEAIATT
jgi:ABC-type antimicrobial peptide transport system permease subunit